MNNDNEQDQGIHSVYKSVLPSLIVEFQDNTFLDVDNIEGFILSKTEDSIPYGIAILETKFGDRPWHDIRAITINGQPGVLLSFERQGFKTAEDGEENFYGYVKLVVRYDFTENELGDIIARRNFNFDKVGEMDEDENEEEGHKDKSTGTILQRSEDSSETD